MNEGNSKGNHFIKNIVYKDHVNFIKSGCPSILLPIIPSGADGVERGYDVHRQPQPSTSTLSISDYEDVIADVLQKCKDAFIHAPHHREARQGYFKVFVGDLADALASVVHVKRVKVEGEGEQRKEFVYRTPQHSAADYWKVAEGVRLTKYKGTNVTRLIAVRKGNESNPDVIFEIFINAQTKKATIKRDDTVLFTIGVDVLSARRVQTVAISALRSYLRENERQNRRGKERIHRRVDERLAAKKEEV